MPAPRKVRIFRDKKKSPNWYVEWRDADGKRHCESCGARRQDAEVRSREVADELRRMRSGKCTVADGHPDPFGSISDTFCKSGSPDNTPAMQIRVSLQFGNATLPVEVMIDVTPELLKTLSQMIATAEPKRL